ncbi:choice-of-anchor M domain-containing protein [Trueperella bialowiezensis]|uniref:Putative ABC transporter-associated repeat protein n=1 Tax=Trueperella bialowiezensis TaxID=312285 RepID=A0A448PED6_9ACTO|nr:choice-of-anchor M domain-containing protein [Trueperella bialowiezensis]VEI13305.1 putative ABC transporter-associated repeat protein [Trueperella bialowiezensis]
MKKLTTGLIALALAAFGLVPGAAATQNDPEQADPALTQVVESDENIVEPGNPVEISAGHIDLGPKFIDGTFTLMARDDTAIEPVWRQLDDVVFRVSDAAKLELPKDDPDYDFINADGEVWVVPQSEIRNVVWLGWSTQDPELIEKIEGGVSLVYGGHEGDGDMHVFVQAGNFTGPQQLWNSTTEAAQPIHVEANSHAHSNWVFTKPGIHLMRLTAQAKLADGTTVEDTRILRFAVGDAADAQAALEAKWSTENLPETVADVAEPSELDQSSSVPLYIGIGLLVLAVGAVAGVALMRSRSAKQRDAAERAVVGNDSHHETGGVQ